MLMMRPENVLVLPEMNFIFWRKIVKDLLGKPIAV